MHIWTICAYVGVFFVIITEVYATNGKLQWSEFESAAMDFNKFDKEPVVGLHLALAGDTSVVVSWLNTGHFVPESQPPICAYGQIADGFQAISTGKAYTYTAGDFDSILNKVEIDIAKIGVKQGDRVYYRCCNPNLGGWSPSYNFTLFTGDVSTLSNFKSQRSPTSRKSAKIALMADLGVGNGRYTAYSISQYVQNEAIQLVVHAGDISYADDFSLIQHNNSFVWTEYFAMIQPFAAYVPYMVGPGNHEAQFDFAAYKNWFTMPYNISQSKSQFYYSFDYMGVHFVAMSTEHDFTPGSTQNIWLEEDLIKASQNREKVPWIFVHGHRPLYCSSIVDWLPRCITEAKTYRANIEHLLYKYKVDIYMAGHNHQYERSYPVYNGTVISKNYINPQATVYIVNGGAGNPEGNDITFMPESFVPWRAKIADTSHTGWMTMDITETSLHFKYILSETWQKYDKFTITRI
ncbi:uncharacterized protein LOC102800613 [Saccoglossus kowalevskii]